jgi:hypothetical protein
VVVWMQRFEICDFVCKKVCIKWECASSGDLRYLRISFLHKIHWHQLPAICQ